MDLMAYPDEKLHVVVNRADSRVGLELKDVERHLGRQVWHSISSSIEVPRALNAGEVLLLSKPGSRVGKELAELVALFEQSSTTNNHGRRLGRFRKRGSEDT
jgi:pilus assembly protein CpaE